MTEVLISVCVNKKTISLNALIDTGFPTSIAKLKSLTNVNLLNKRSKRNYWTTNGGGFTKKSKAPIVFKMLEFAPSKDITWTFQLDENDSNYPYDMILGCYIQYALGMDILWYKEAIV